MWMMRNDISLEYKFFVRIIPWIFFLIFQFFSISSWASFSTDYTLDSQQQIFATVYQEGGYWHAILYQKRERRLPRFIVEKSFLTAKDLEIFLSRHKSAMLLSDSPAWSDRHFVTEDKDEVIWKATQTWSMDWEKKYGDWVTNNVDENFFVKYQIATDCADVALALRWIFSRIHFLPMGSRLVGDGVLFTHESMKNSWKKLRTHENWWQDERFMKALSYVLSMSYTHSLLKDSYPVEISNNYFLPGVHHLNLYSNETGHTMMVSRVGKEVPGGVQFLYSNVPKGVRTLITGYLFLTQTQIDQEEGGFLKIRWLSWKEGTWTLLTGDEIAGNSEMQYTRQFTRGYRSFSEAILGHLNLEYRIKEQFELAKNFFLVLVQERAKVVQEGYEICLRENCDLGSVNYENWATERRDLRLKDIVMYIESLSKKYSDLSWKWSLIKRTTQVQSAGLNINMTYFVEALLRGKVSSDPKDPPKKRWGLGYYLAEQMTL